MSINESHKQIEDIVDARNESGQYDILCNGIKNFNFQQENTRYGYSSAACVRIPERNRDDVSNYNIEGGNPDLRCIDADAIGPTDSEITLIRVKREGNQIKKAKENKWGQMRDLVIPGDGTHLGESPSLVNLVTLVIPNENPKSESKGHEYLVPLSSWEPKHQENSNLDNLSEDSSDNQSQNNSLVSNTLSANFPTPRQPILTPPVSKPKSTTSIKCLFKRLAFWKRKSDDRFNGNNNN